MTPFRNWAPTVLCCLCLAAPGCSSEKKPEKKVVKIGGADAEPAPVAQNPAVQIKAAATGETAAPADRPQKPSNSSSLPDDGELGAGQGRYAVLPSTAPGGAPFAVNGPDSKTNVDRFAVVPPRPGIDSTKFGYGAGTASGDAATPGSTAGVPHPPDESNTEYEPPDGFTPIESAGESESGLPWRIRCDEDGAVMALIPEGISIQGTNAGAFKNAAPEHGVMLDAFYIDLREVTYARYDKFRDATSDKRRVPRPARASLDPQEPVMGVTWAEAHAFAIWAGKDLPTEAQWEKAARGPDGFKFPWGNGPFIWQRRRDPGQIDRVASFPGDVSPYGVCDMAGNAREWCSDFYGEKYYSQLLNESGSTARNPTGPKASSGGSNLRVVKGGDPDWYVWGRTGISITERPNDVGFRCVLKLKPVGSTSSKAGKKK